MSVYWTILMGSELEAAAVQTHCLFSAARFPASARSTRNACGGTRPAWPVQAASRRLSEKITREVLSSSAGRAARRTGRRDACHHKSVSVKFS